LDAHIAAMTPDELQAVVAQALAAGAQSAEAAFAERQSLSVSVRLGELEEVEREESRDLGLRVLIGQRHASVSGSDTSEEGRRKLVTRVIAMAKLAAEDPYAGLPPKDRLATAPPSDLDLYDPSEPTAEALEARALAAEQAARDVPRVSNSNGASAGWSSSVWRFASSDGFVGEQRGTASSISAGAIAGEGSEMEQGYEGRSTRWLSDLPTPDSIGAEAGRRAVASLGARKLPSMTAPVIFENRLSGALISPLLGAISGPAVARGVSFLKDKLGARLFSPGVTLTDDPHEPRGLGSSAFDDEGVANRRWDIIEDGILTTWLLNSSSARQLGMATTGHAARSLAGPPGVSPSNLTLAPGPRDQAGLMAEAGHGVLITSMFGPSLNSNTGDWSVGCSGLWFENGEVAYPVTEITVAGNLVDIYARMIAGADLFRRGSALTPSVLVDALAIAGK
jgi:PmbA protein